MLLMADQNESIVSLHEVFESATEFVLILEMIEGGEIQKILDTGDSIDEQNTARLVRQILEAVSYLHQNNIAHLDIKVSYMYMYRERAAAQLSSMMFS